MRNCDRDGNDNVRSDCRWQALSLSLIVGARHSFEVLDCRVALWPSGALVFAFERGAAAEAVDVDFEDRGVVDEAIDRGEGHGGIWKDRLLAVRRGWEPAYAGSRRSSFPA